LQKIQKEVIPKGLFFRKYFLVCAFFEKGAPRGREIKEKEKVNIKLFIKIQNNLLL